MCECAPPSQSSWALCNFLKKKSLFFQLHARLSCAAVVSWEWGGDGRLVAGSLRSRPVASMHGARLAAAKSICTAAALLWVLVVGAAELSEGPSAGGSGSTGLEPFHFQGACTTH